MRPRNDTGALVVRFTRTKFWLVILTAVIIVGVGIFTYVNGPIDHIPRLRVSATSPDQALTVSVYKKQLAFFPQGRVGILVRVWETNGNLIYDRIIFEDDSWNWDIGDMYSKIAFENDEIRIGPKFTPDDYFVIRKAELRVRKP